MIVRISRGSYPPVRHAEFTARMAKAGEVLIPAIRKLPGCVNYFAATDETSSTMVNVSVWESMEHAQAMATLPEMSALAKQFIALGVEFERPIINYPALWEIS